MRRIIVFDDAGGRLAPLTDLRPSFDVRTGALTTLERVRRVLDGQVIGLWVPESLRVLARLTHAEPVNATIGGSGVALIYNGRCPVPPEGLGSLREGEALIEPGTGELVAACLDAGRALDAAAGRVPASVTARRELPAPSLLARPWHLRRYRDAAIRIDLELLALPERRTPDEPSPAQELFEAGVAGVTLTPGAAEPLRLGGAALTVHKAARVYPGAILDLERGPIVIDEGAIVRPGAILIGPVYIGPHSTILERATIRQNTAIGPWCKVNGEVGGTIFQGYANKAHDGYLGDSWVGEWVNLGAGTTNSNLLNTYEEIIAVASPGMSNERTGETFLGATIGDHVKTAIGTRLMTGCVLHTGGMFATTAPVSGATPPFAWSTDAGLRRYRLDKFLAVARAMMHRRNIEPSAAYLERLTALHASAI
ncbi:MAG: hypothetical protein HBSAPP03_17500 [Phycisphaerae bacterium]|nr:MAG: hypothetical protein HBSAPP03_17500 [Phycisphaerae bacterium]